MFTFMLRALVVSALVTVAAYLLERALRHIQLAGRHAWTLALLASTLLPFVPQLLPSRAPIIVIPAISLPALEVTAVGAAQPINYLLYGWIILSVLAAVVYAIAYVRLQGARREWQEENVASQLVFVSKEFGPAVFGFRRPRIVVPEWVRTATSEEQRLIVLHEREHIRASDHLLVLLVVAANAVMPWNPFIWVQSRRLRFALEADCDQRVLRDRESDARRYAQLLVDVGGRQMGMLVTAALAEHRNGLERRIGMIATRIAQNWWKAAALAVASVGIGVVACESRLPTEPRQPQPSNTRVAAPAQIDENNPMFTPYTETPLLANREEVTQKLIAAYPPALKSQGKGGSTLLWVLISETGSVMNTKIKTSSGEPEIDQAATEVARTMKFRPALNRDEPVKVWVALPIVFKTDAAKPDPAPRFESKTAPKAFTEQEPSFSAYTKEPALVNRTEVSDALVKAYPPALRDKGTGGMTIVWVLIGTDGKVENTKIKTPSGEAGLDEAALAVARTMKFTPAENIDRPVKVWVALPINFTVK